MAKQSQIIVQIIVTGDGMNETYQMPIITNPAAPGGGPIALALASGFNTIPVPPGSTGVWIIPSASSAVGKTLKGITGDTGQPISPNSPTFIALVSPVPASIFITATAPETITLQWT
jgi:hypothetical protein